MKFTPDKIWSLQPGQVFVFGSNEAGRHGAGAALLAKQQFGAEPGKGFGHFGRSFAIPTKDAGLKPLPLDSIGEYVFRFIDYAYDHFELEFLVTQIGCGLAGFNAAQIAPFFVVHPPNVVLPREFHNALAVHQWATKTGPGLENSKPTLDTPGWSGVTVPHR